MRIRLLAILIVTTLEGLAQVNLVPNGSFEDIIDCPGTYEDVSTAPSWFRPTKGSPDLFNVCGTGGGIVPENAFGYQPTQDGEGYAGSYVFSNFGQYDAREYIAVKLTENLKPEMHYCFKMYVALAEIDPFVISSVGAYFSSDSIYINDYNPMPYIPQIKNPDTNFINDTTSWQLICSNFKAQGGERYLYIGNFRDSTSTIKYSPTNGYEGTYIYIDNVQLYECDSLNAIAENTPKNKLTYYPNPTNGQLYIETTGTEKITLRVFDVNGKMVQEQIIPNPSPQQLVELQGIDNGIYLLQVLQGKKSQQGKLVVIRL